MNVKLIIFNEQEIAENNDDIRITRQILNIFFKKYNIPIKLERTCSECDLELDQERLYVRLNYAGYSMIVTVFFIDSKVVSIILEVDEGLYISHIVRGSMEWLSFNKASIDIEFKNNRHYNFNFSSLN